MAAPILLIRFSGAAVFLSHLPVPITVSANYAFQLCLNLGERLGTVTTLLEQDTKVFIEHSLDLVPLRMQRRRDHHICGIGKCSQVDIFFLCPLGMQEQITPKQIKVCGCVLIIGNNRCLPFFTCQEFNRLKGCFFVFTFFRDRKTRAK